MTNLTRRGRNATSAATLPALPAAPRSVDEETRRWMENVREWLEVRLGARGDFYERAVTHRELRDALDAVTSTTTTTPADTDPLLIQLRNQLRGLDQRVQFAQNQWLTNSNTSSTLIQNINNQVRDVAVQDVPVFARDMLPSVTGGCSVLTAVEFASTQPNFHALLFDPTTDESADFHAMLPTAWAGKQFYIMVYWGHGTAATSFNVKWELQANSTSDQETLILDFVTGSYVEDTGGTGGDLYVGTSSAVIPIASNQNRDGDMVSMRITRRNSGVTGNLDIDAALLAVRFVLGDVVFPGTPTDPYFAQVVLLLHCEGTDGSTTIDDSSQYARTGTGNAQLSISTTRGKFGSSSLKVTQREPSGIVFGSGGHADFGTTEGEPFTMECWVYVVSVVSSTATPSLIRWERTTSPFRDALQVYSAGTVPLAYGDTEAFGDQMTPTAFTANTWVHLAYTFDGTNADVWVDGTSVGTWARSPSAQTSGTIYIGGTSAAASGGAIEVYIDEVRITKGVARYTATFTPPTEAFPDS